MEGHLKGVVSGMKGHEGAERVQTGTEGYEEV